MIGGTYDIGNHCDFCGTTITMPFSISLYGESFTRAIATSKGTLAFGTAHTAFDVQCLPFSNATYVMAPFWVDQGTYTDDCESCGIFTSTTGIAPNRIFTVEWRTFYFGQHNTSPTLDFEVQLLEGQSTFKYVYGLVTSYSETDTALTIGVQLSRDLNIYTSYYCDPTGETAPPLTGQQITWVFDSCGTPSATLTVTSTRTPTSTSTIVPVETSTLTPVLTETPRPTETLIITPTACPFAFEDVPPDSTFYPYIQCLSCLGIINGYPCGGDGEPCVAPGNRPYFRPGNNITRGQLSKVVANAAGFVEPAAGQTFEDVPPSSTFYAYIERLAARSVMNGYPCGGDGEPCIAPGNRPYFRPGNNATRGQIAKIVSQAANQGGNPTTQTFEDVAIGSTFWLWIERLSATGAITGYPCGNPEPCIAPGNRPYFRPANSATRGQVSKIVSNTFFPACPISR